MPRQMPPFASRYEDGVGNSLLLAEGFEIARERSDPGSDVHSALAVARLERVYELAFLRVFAEWEVFLEETCIRYMCGYVSPMYVPDLKIDKQRTIADARSHLCGGQDYVLLHNPHKVKTLAHERLENSPIELVVNTSLNHLKTWLQSGIELHIILETPNVSSMKQPWILLGFALEAHVRADFCDGAIHNQIPGGSHSWDSRWSD